MKRLYGSLLLTLLAVVTAAISMPAWAADASTLAEGSWTKKSFAIEGSWTLEQRGDEVFVVLSSDFSTKKAPDLKIFLSPKTLGELSNKNATEGSVLVAPLTSHEGGQEYALPAGVDWKSYETLAVHCEKYSKLWAGAELPKP